MTEKTTRPLQACYIRVRGGKVYKTVTLMPGVNADYDMTNTLLGFEFLAPLEVSIEYKEEEPVSETPAKYPQFAIDAATEISGIHWPMKTPVVNRQSLAEIIARHWQAAAQPPAQVLCVACNGNGSRSSCDGGKRVACHVCQGTGAVTDQPPAEPVVEKRCAACGCSYSEFSKQTPCDCAHQEGWPHVWVAADGTPIRPVAAPVVESVPAPMEYFTEGVKLMKEQGANVVENEQPPKPNYSDMQELVKWFGEHRRPVEASTLDSVVTRSQWLESENARLNEWARTLRRTYAAEIQERSRLQSQLAAKEQEATWKSYGSLQVEVESLQSQLASRPALPDRKQIAIQLWGAYTAGAPFAPALFGVVDGLMQERFFRMADVVESQLAPRWSSAGRLTRC